MQSTIGIIGGGNMGSCLVGGLLKQGYPADKIKIADHSAQTCALLHQKWGIFSSVDNQKIASLVDILILAVKPHQLKTVLEKLVAECDLSKKLLISIAAGVTTSQIQSLIGTTAATVIRAMPNTPALIGYGMTGLFAGPFVSDSQAQQAENIFHCVGKTIWLSQESLMDVVTALSGSGPAYFFYFFEALIKSAEALGLTKEVARKLTLETALGSAYMALNQPGALADLREKVTSPGGTTQQGIQALKDGKLEVLVFEALKAAALKGRELSQQYD